MARVRAGEERAFEALVHRYRTRLLAFCRGMLRSSEDAEDVLQEVFVAAHRAILADGRTLDVRPWLYRIARNRCLNHLRGPRPERSSEIDEHAHASPDSTEERAARRQDLRDLVADIHDLPETQRSALLLRELEALSYAQIAEALTTSVAAVKSLLVRARMSLATASRSRDLRCDQVRRGLAGAAEGLGRLDAPARHHLRHCGECRRYQAHLRSISRGLATLLPVGPLVIVRRMLGAKLGGGAGATGGTVAVGGGGLLSTQAATGLTAVALLGAGGAGTVAATGVPSPAHVISSAAGRAQPAATTTLARAAPGDGQGSDRAAAEPEGDGGQIPGEEGVTAAEPDERDGGDTEAAEEDAEADTEHARTRAGARRAHRRRLVLAHFGGDRVAARQWWLRTRGSGGSAPTAQADAPMAAPPRTRTHPPRPAPPPPAAPPARTRQRDQPPARTVPPPHGSPPPQQPPRRPLPRPRPHPGQAP